MEPERKTAESMKGDLDYNLFFNEINKEKPKEDMPIMKLSKDNFNQLLRRPTFHGILHFNQFVEDLNEGFLSGQISSDDLNKHRRVPTFNGILDVNQLIDDINEGYRAGKISSDDFNKLPPHPTFGSIHDAIQWVECISKGYRSEKIPSDDCNKLPEYRTVRNILEDLMKGYRSGKIPRDDWNKLLQHPTFHGFLNIFNQLVENPNAGYRSGQIPRDDCNKLLQRPIFHGIVDVNQLVEDFIEGYRSGKISSDDLNNILRHPTFQRILGMNQLVDDLNDGTRTGKILIDDFNTLLRLPTCHLILDINQLLEDLGYRSKQISSEKKRILLIVRVGMNLWIPGSGAVIDVFEGLYYLKIGNRVGAGLNFLSAIIDFVTLGLYSYYKTIAYESAKTAVTTYAKQTAKTGYKEWLTKELSKNMLREAVQRADHDVFFPTITTFFKDSGWNIVENGGIFYWEQILGIALQRFSERCKSAPEDTFKTPTSQASYDAARRAMSDYANLQSGIVMGKSLSFCALKFMMKDQDKKDPKRDLPSPCPIDMSSSLELKFRRELEACTREGVPSIANPMASVTKTPGVDLSLRDLQKLQFKAIYSNISMMTLNVQNELERKRTDGFN